VKVILGQRLGLVNHCRGSLRAASFLSDFLFLLYRTVAFGAND
jgi:hypothetical protein